VVNMILGGSLGLFLCWGFWHLANLIGMTPDEKKAHPNWWYW
jgi:hypothetical protein